MSTQRNAKQGNISAKLLLHTCCAGCLVESLEGLEEDGFAGEDIVLYFDNSNIHPRSEWLARLEAVKKVVEERSLELVVEDWSPKKWFEAIEGKSDNANLRRCELCWKFRVERARDKAIELGCNSFTTTLLVSKHQNREMILGIGKELENKSVKFHELRRIESVSCDFKGYKQNYCGCMYSLVERFEEKFE